MAGAVGTFKSIARTPRSFNTESNFLLGMMDTQGTIPDGYVRRLINFDIINDGQNLQPRPGLRTTKLFIPNVAAESAAADFHNPASGFQLHFSAVRTEEDGRNHYQFIAGECPTDTNVGTLYALTGQEAMQSDAPDAVAQKIVLNSRVPDDSVTLGYTMLNTQTLDTPLSSGCFFNKPIEAKIHNIPLSSDYNGDNENIANIIGTEALGQYYFLTPDKREVVGVAEEDWPAVKMRHTKFDSVSGLYVLEDVVIKEPTASEAATYGLNMLLDDPETFSDKVDSGMPACTFQGLLLYDLVTEHIELYPRKNRTYKVQLNYAAPPSSDKWLIKFSWREQSDVSWNEFHAVQVDMAGRADGSDLPEISKNLTMPSINIMIRAEAYKLITNLTGLTLGIDYFKYGANYYEIVNTTSTLVGFHLNNVADKNMQNTQMVNYDLLTATGMGSFKNRIFLYGVTKDPKLMFISDLNDPGYFPYPTNTVIFDDPIIHVTQSLDTLIVVTTKQALQVKQGPDGMSWYTTVVQDHLALTPWDRQLVQPVKNMVMFMSGNYYYLLVPKATSLTGELTLAPISKPITVFLDNFLENIQLCVSELYPAVSVKDLSLVNYFNYLDYEDIHNIYVFKYDGVYLHVDLQYNYITRAWKLSMYENSQIVCPFENNATQRGELVALTNFEDLVVQSFTTLEVNNVAGTAATETSELKLVGCSLDIRDSYDLRVELIIEGVSTYLTFTTKTFDAVSKRFYWSNANGQQLIIPSEPTDYYGVRVRQSSNNPAYRIAIPDSWKVAAYISGSWVQKSAGASTWPRKGQVFNYTFADALELGSILRVVDKVYAIHNIVNNANGIDEYQDTTVAGGEIDIKQLGTLDYQIIFEFSIAQGVYPVVQTSSIVVAPGSATTGRGVQTFKYNKYVKKDYYITGDEEILCPDNLLDMTPAEQYEAMAQITAGLGGIIVASYPDDEEAILFKNWQYLDSGNRDYAVEHQKRYRELQILVNNLDKEALDFSLAFSIDGENCNMVYNFEEEQLIDIHDQKYGLLYLTPNPIIEEVAELGTTTTLGQFNLETDTYPDISLWKIRMNVGGKGYSPRFKLISRNDTDYTLMKYTWVYRVMNLR